MSSIKKKKQKKVKIPKMSLYESIPDDIKMLFGKFYAYSLLNAYNNIGFFSLSTKSPTISIMSISIAKQPLLILLSRGK